MWFYIMKVEPVDGPANEFRLYIETEGGQSGVFDMKAWIEDEEFLELQDIEYFRKAHVKMGEVVWPNGQYLTSSEILSEIAPETLCQKESTL